MKWYWWILILAIVLIIFYFVWKQNKKLSQEHIDIIKNKLRDSIINQSVVPVYNNDSSEVLKNRVQNLINNKLSFIEIKSTLEKTPGVIVLKSTDTHTMEYNPNRIILEVIEVNCITTPCPEQIKIISIG